MQELSVDRLVSLCRNVEYRKAGQGCCSAFLVNKLSASIREQNVLFYKNLLCGTIGFTNDIDARKSIGFLSIQVVTIRTVDLQIRAQPDRL